MSKFLTVAEASSRRIKMLIFGESGIGKTFFSLHAPGIAMIDTERGTDHYGKFTTFDRIQTSSYVKIMALIDELLENPEKYKTLIIDSISALYNSMVAEREAFMRIKLGKSDYVAQAADYRVVSSQIKALILKLNALDMNIFIIARSSAKYDKNEFMKVIGTKADGPEKILYEVDTIIEVIREGEKRIAITFKDRTNQLPPTWEFSWANFTEYVNMEQLNRDPIIINQIKSLEDISPRKTTVKFNNKEIKTAGVNADSLKKLQEIIKRIGEDKFKEKLMNDYMLQSVFDLNNDEALLLIKDLTV